jgi:ABC-type dipeptide/oligopeptide/nickel transport system permease subunit
MASTNASARRPFVRSRGVKSSLYWVISLLILGVTIWKHGDGHAAQTIKDRLQSPSSAHWLGTDSVGRDNLKELLQGVPWSIEVSLLATLIAAVVGTAIGVVSGWYGHWWARAILRLVDFQVAFPFVVMAVVLIGVLGRGTLQISLVLGIALWPLIARVVYSETLQLREQEYVVYSNILWGSGLRVIREHLIPALLIQVSVVSAFVFGDILGAAAALSLLGIGPSLETPSWGNMLADGQQYLDRDPWIAFSSALALILLVVFVNLLADRLALAASRYGRAVSPTEALAPTQLDDNDQLRSNL